MIRAIQHAHWIWGFLVAAVMGCYGRSAAAADVGFSDIRTIRVLPRTEAEIAAAHERSRGSACEIVPPAEPLEISGFMPCLTDRDRAEWDRGRLLWPSSRRHMFSVGLDMLQQDRKNLPRVSAGQIQRYIDSHYVTVQARVQKDPATGELFLHHRPLAATCSFGRGRLTEDFNEATLSAVREFHSLGIFLPGGESQRARNLRTLVLVFRNLITLPGEFGGKPRLKPNFEYLFVRGREVEEGGSRQMTLFAFATSEQRQQLHMLQPWEPPTTPHVCGIHAKVLFTEYSTLGLIPTKSATRSISFQAQSVFDWQALNRYTQEQGWRGDALDNLPAALDAIIDRKLTP